MFIMSNRNINLPNKDHSEFHRVERGFVGNIPDQFAKTAYFKELVKAGKIALVKSTADKDARKAKEAADKALEEAEEAARKATEEAEDTTGTDDPTGTGENAGE